MTGKRSDGSWRARSTSPIFGMAGSGSFSSDDMALMQGAFDAVCRELRIGPQEGGRRDEVARRIMTTYQTGRRAPLYLVHAGLSEHA